VRELQNVIERSVIMSVGEPVIEVSELIITSKSSQAHAVAPPYPEILPGNGKLPTVDELERRLIACTLIQTANNKTKAAKNLGISLRTLRNKLRTFRDAGLDTELPETWL
jgi:DNA-binding NtrC family response regulator